MRARWSISQIGMMLGVSSLMGIVASPLGGELAARFGEKRWLVGALFASYTCFMLAILLKEFWLFILFYLAQRFFAILGMPARAGRWLRPPIDTGERYQAPRNHGGGFIADYYGLYPIFITTSVIYFIGLTVLQFGVKTG